MADGLFLDGAEAVEACVQFFLEESRGYWHNRARAMIARRLKHCAMTAKQLAAVTACILERLETGNFTEQFKDQLRFALHFDRQRTVESARRIAKTTQKAHVRKYADWILRNHG